MLSQAIGWSWSLFFIYQRRRQRRWRRRRRRGEALVGNLSEGPRPHRNIFSFSGSKIKFILLTCVKILTLLYRLTLYELRKPSHWCLLGGNCEGYDKACNVALCISWIGCRKLFWSNLDWRNFRTTLCLKSARGLQQQALEAYHVLLYHVKKWVQLRVA